MNLVCRIQIPLLTIFLGVSCIGQALPVAHATTIAGIRRPAQVVIAADSLGTARGYRIESTPPVCKIFTVKDTAFAIAGLVKDPAWNFDAEKRRSLCARCFCPKSSTAILAVYTPA